MKSSRWAVFALSAGLVALLPARAGAEIAFGESIEWVIADSDRVLSGTVVRVDQVPGKDGKAYEVATVRVSRTLKGQPAAEVKFLLRNYRGPVAKQWRAMKLPMLFFVVARERANEPGFPPGVEWVLRDDHNDHCAVLLGKSNERWTFTIPVLTRDFDVLTDPDAILKRVETAVRAQPGGPKRKPHKLGVPPDTAVYNKLWARSAVYLTVPVDRELEALGRRWCRSPSFSTRIDGAKILGHFKNEENIKRLKALLNDPDYSTEEAARTVPGQRELVLLYRKRLYEVRRIAYETLRRFGVEVRRPVLEELLEGKS
jgi:hypothetical protein